MPPPHNEQQTKGVLIPNDLHTLFFRGASLLVRGLEGREMMGEWAMQVQDGVIFLRRGDLSKWPEHDKSPEKKRQERNESAEGE